MPVIQGKLPRWLQDGQTIVVSGIGGFPDTGCPDLAAEEAVDENNLVADSDPDDREKSAEAE